MIKKLSLVISVIIFLFFYHANAFDLGLGAHRLNDKTQDSSGNDENDPYSMAISIGNKWEIYSPIKFAPRFGYIRQTNNTDDRYGGDYLIESFYLLCDFTYPILSMPNFNFLYGFGNFRKTITGSGGDVTVPNGSGTMTAYRPGKSSASYTLSLNLGLEYFFDWRGTTVTDQGISTEIFIMQPFNKEKRMLAWMLSYLLQF